MRILTSAGETTDNFTSCALTFVVRQNKPAQRTTTTTPNCLLTRCVSTIASGSNLTQRLLDQHVCFTSKSQRLFHALAQSAAGRLYPLRHDRRGGAPSRPHVARDVERCRTFR